MSQAWRRQRVRLRWGRLNVYVAGDGPPLLLLHGLGGSGRYWAGLAPHLAATRTLIAPDLAGFGRSDKPSVDYSRAFHVDSLDALLEALGVATPLALAGHSMGGVLAALFAARHPERIESLALAAAPFPRPQTHPSRLPGGVAGRAFYSFVQTTLPLVSPLVRSQTYPRAVIADYLRHTRASYRLSSRSLIWDVGVIDELAGLRSCDSLPALLMYSADDRTIASDSLQRWQQVLPRAETLLVAGGHQLLLRGGFSDLAQWVARPMASRVA
ncbi:MAG: alpha/beta fold hydrolase [Candidatus Dormibacter sp.]